MTEFHNKTIIIGRLGRDPEIEHTANGDVARFAISNNTIKDGVELVNWHRIKAVGKQAQLCVEYLHKGDLCCIEGSLNYRMIDGERRNITIIADHITFLSQVRKQAVEA